MKNVTDFRKTVESGVDPHLTTRNLHVTVMQIFLTGRQICISSRWYFFALT